MDQRDNKFKYMDDVSDEDKQFLIPFDIGEEVIIKGYRFEIEKVDIDANLLTLKPLGKIQGQPVELTTINPDRQDNFKREIDKLKAKGGLGA